jgi:hypothetical protein
MSITVYALATNPAHALVMVTALPKDGFRTTDLSVLYHQAPADRAPAASAAGTVTPVMPAGTLPPAMPVPFPAVAAAPDAPGMPSAATPVPGSSPVPVSSPVHAGHDDGPAGILGALPGIGIIALPGVRPLVASGPMKASLTAVGAAGLAGNLIGLGIPEQEAKRYEAGVFKGGVLVAVQADDQAWLEKAKAVFKTTGAKEVSGTGFATPAVAATA